MKPSRKVKEEGAGKGKDVSDASGREADREMGRKLERD